MTSPVQHSECTRTKGNAAGCFFEQSIKCGWKTHHFRRRTKIPYIGWQSCGYQWLHGPKIGASPLQELPHGT